MSNTSIDINNLPQLTGYGGVDLIIDWLEDDDTRTKYYRKLEVLIRGSLEMKNYIQFLKKEMDMSTCAILQEVKSGEWSTIELHHFPFTLYDIVDAVHRKHEKEGLSLSQMAICKEVVELHYRNLIGLVPLSTTMHELYHNEKLEIDIRSVFGDIRQFAIEYTKYLDKRLAAKVRRMVKVANENKAETNNRDILKLRTELKTISGEGTIKNFIEMDD